MAIERFTHENGQVSGTKSLLSLFVGIVCFKYLLAGLAVGDWSVAPFDGTGEAAVIAALGATYAGRRLTQARYQDDPASYSGRANHHAE